MSDEQKRPSQEELDRLTRQLSLEDEYRSAGYKKAVRNDHRNKERNYGSHTSLGNLVRRELTGYVAEFIKVTYEEIQAGKAGVGHAYIKDAFPSDVNWNRISHIALVTLLDFVFYTSKSASDVNLEAGKRIQDDLRMRFYKKTDPDLYDFCEKRYMRNEASYQQKIYSTTKVFKKSAEEKGSSETTYSGWDNATSRRVGAWLIACIHQVFSAVTNLPFLALKPVATNGKHSTDAYCLHPDIRDLELNQQIQEGLKANYQDNPMVCPPLDWTVDSYGGFLTNHVTKRYDLVRGRHSTVPSEIALKTLNNLQQVAWRINPFVLEQFNYFYSRGESINTDDPFKPFLQPEDHDIPTLPRHLVDLPKLETALNPQDKVELEHLHDERSERMKQINLWWNELAKRRKNGRIHMLVWQAANRFASEERFWMPWSFDFRTRMYPISILNPQSANHINGLLEFADGHPIDDTTHKWLSIHLATTRGFSKETFEGRQQWVKNHEREIILVATDPLGEGRTFWTEEADEPWTYLAACKEYYDLFIAKTKTVTHIPCGLDATASGLQILGALMGDESTCDLVNVLPTKKPSDLYQVIIDKTIKLAKEKRGKYKIPYDQLTRKVAKAPTMTLAYGSTPWRRKKQVQEACNSKRGLNLNLKWDQIEYVAERLDDAISFVLPGVTFTLKWLQEVAVASMDDHVNPGKLIVKWTTPAGSEVHQCYFKSQYQRIRTVALGMTKFHKPRVLVDTQEPDLSKIESSTAANFVHSLDASVFQLAGRQFNGPFSYTHDCFYAPAGESLERLTQLVKSAFVDVVSGNTLDDFAVCSNTPEFINQLKENRNRDFDYEQIYDSTYLFC
jgi:DNA-directed RNA polymerase